MTEGIKALSGMRIGVFAKGGAGKSTIVVLLAKALRDLGYDVCVLDADSTNVGLHRALGLDRSPVPLMEYFGGTVFRGGAVTCPVNDPNPLPGAAISLDSLPQKYYVKNRDGIALLVVGKVGDQGPGAGCDGPVSKIARDLRIYDSASVHVLPREQRWKQVAAGMHMHRDGGCLVTPVDFKAGLEDSARGAITSLDWAVVVIDPTSAAIQLAAEIRNTVDQIRAGELPATGHLQDADLVDAANKVFREATINGVLFVLNKVDDSETENYIRRRLKKEGIEPIGAIGRDPSIAAAWLKGAPIRGTKVKRDAQRVVGMLEMAETVHCILTSAQEGQQATVH